MSKAKLGVLSAGLLLALLATYSNHFHNSFHFDDSHAIEGNPYIRDLGNIPKFFADATTFSVLPPNQSYRPIVTTSLAIDYRLSNGLNPLWFHIDVFAWYIVQLALMVLLFVKIMNLTRPAPQNTYLALFAVAWYGLHPVSAETVNYMIQRGDLYSTLGVVAGLVLYAYWPGGRKWGVYLLPVAVGALAKPVALIFAPILFVYVLLFENRSGDRQGAVPLLRAARTCVPSVVVCAALGIFGVAMTPKTFTTGALSRVHYWYTQPMVLLHYVKSFFLPTELSADTDRQLVTDLWSETSVIGIAFLVAFGFATWRALRSREMRPAAFGLLWFIIASLPTSLTPLAEVENDHRMFFPFVGLALAVVWTGAAWLEKRTKSIANSPLLRAALAGGALCLLGAYAYGAHVRNEVWRTEESLWQDVAAKSPRNGRGLMNYGLTLMGRGDFQGALRYFQNALPYTPNYSSLHVNLGIAYGAIGNNAEAESHFRQALALAPSDVVSYYFYARWLREKGRVPEAATLLQKAVELNPAHMDSRYLLMVIYSEQNDVDRLKNLAGQTLGLFPNDKSSADYLAWANDLNRKPKLPDEAAAKNPIEAAELAAKQSPSAQAFLNLSMLYCQAGRHEDCIAAAKSALKLKPDYAEAYNNIAVGYNGLKMWDEAIQAAQQAVKLKPDFQLARNNLNWSQSQKARLAQR